MLTDNIIKQNNFHVEEDFYEEIINGLQSLKEREQARKTKQPIIILPKQARFITRVTTPVIMDLAKPLVESITRFEFQREKEIAKHSLRARFMKAWAKLSVENDELDDDVEKLDGKRFSIRRVFRIIKTFRNISRVYTALKLYKKSTRPRILIQPGELFNLPPDVVDAYFTEVIHGQKDSLVNVIAAFMFPIAKNVFTTYDAAVEKLYEEFLYWMFKTLIFDYTDWVDWALLAITIVAAIYSGGAGGAAILAVATAGKIGRIMQKAKKIFKAVKTVTEVAKIKFLYRVPWKDAKRFSKIAKNAPKAQGFLGKGKSMYKAYKAKRAKMSWGYKVYKGFDLLDVTKEDVQDYKEYITRRCRVWGSRFEAKYSDDLSRMLETGADFFLFADELVLDRIQGVMEDGAIKEDSISAAISKKYGRQVTVKGFKKLNVVKVLNYLVIKFQVLWTKVAKSLKRLIITDKDIDYKNRRITFENKKYVTFFFGDSDKKWNKIHTEKIVDNELALKKNGVLFGMDYYRVSRDEYDYVYLLKGTQSYKKNRKTIAAGYRVADKSFKRIYLGGLAVGVQFKIINDTVDAHNVGVNFIDKKFSIISNIEKMKKYVTLYDDGVIAFAYDNFEELRGSLNKILNYNEDRVKEEKKSLKIISEITDMIMRAAGGQNKSHQKKLIEEAKKRAETKVRLEAKRKAEAEARAKAAEEARRKAEYEKKGWWARRGDDIYRGAQWVYTNSGQKAVHDAHLLVASWAWNNTFGNRIK